MKTFISAVSATIATVLAAMLIYFACTKPEETAEFMLVSIFAFMVIGLLASVFYLTFYLVEQYLDK